MLKPKRKAVELRLQGIPISKVALETGLSAPTIIALVRTYTNGGWEAVENRSPGRPKKASIPSEESSLREAAFRLKPEEAGSGSPLWSTKSLAAWLSDKSDTLINERSTLRRIKDWGVHPPVPSSSTAGPEYKNFAEQAKESEFHLLWAGDHVTPDGQSVLFARNAKGQLYWLPAVLPLTDEQYVDFVNRLLEAFPKGVALALQFAGLRYTPKLKAMLGERSSRLRLIEIGPAMESRVTETPSLNRIVLPSGGSAMSLTHLQRLEAESIEIMREAVAEAENPVMLYSIGKDSAVMLRLALKAFHPAKLPFPLLHVDTKWKFQDMYAFRERMAQEHGFDLRVHVNPEGEAQGINPFTHGSAIHTDIMKTQGLRQALEKYKFDLAFGGARRDEEKSRAKERIFSFRSAQHRWDPKAQRPEIWNIYNVRKHAGESIRVFPLSNWTELDIWQYIYLEDIPIVPLYYSKPRPVVERDGTLIMVDDDRMPLRPGEVPQMKSVRFRTLGCYPLTGAIESKANTLTDIIQEMLLATTSERQGRVIDHDSAGSMEKKKQEGYF